MDNISDCETADTISLIADCDEFSQTDKYAYSSKGDLQIKFDIVNKIYILSPMITNEDNEPILSIASPGEFYLCRLFKVKLSMKTIGDVCLETDFVARSTRDHRIRLIPFIEQGIVDFVIEIFPTSNDINRKEHIISSNITHEMEKIQSKCGIQMENNILCRGFNEPYDIVTRQVLFIDSRLYIPAEILSLHSSRFENSLFHREQESDQETTFIDITSNDMKHFLDIVTKRKIIDESSLSVVLNVAHLFDAPHIKNKCEDFIIQSFHIHYKKLKALTGVRIAYNYPSSQLVLAHKYNLWKLANYVAQEVQNVHEIVDCACAMAKVKAINYDMMKILISNTKGKKFCERTEVLINFSVTGDAEWTGDAKFELFRDLCRMHGFVFDQLFDRYVSTHCYVRLRLKERAIKIRKVYGEKFYKWAGLANEANDLATSHGISLVAWLCKCEDAATSYITLDGNICQKRCEGSDCYQVVFGRLVGDKSAIEYLSQQDDDTLINMITNA